MPLPHAGAALCAAALLMLLPQARAQDWRDEPYVGLRVRDSAGGVVVSWVLPGPLGGTGFESRAGLRRGDVIVAAGLPGQPPATITSAEEFTASQRLGVQPGPSRLTSPGRQMEPSLEPF